MHTIEELLAYPEISDSELKELLHNAVQIVEDDLPAFTNVFPHNSSLNHFYAPSENVGWTTGFWTGEVWLAYEQTKDAKFKAVGDVHVQSFLDRVTNKVDIGHHDMGFLYSLSCVAAYQLTGNEDAKKAAIMAADALMLRFQEKGQFFQAWGELGAENNYRLIIDCLLNMPLLFRASEYTGDPTYREKAEAHIRTAMQYVIRQDHSTYHTYFFDPATGLPRKGVTHQGNRDGSAWARGQAWGVYGSALAYSVLKDPMYLDVFEKVTDFFLTNLPKDLIPYWDFDFTDGSTEPRDSSAAAIAICGMLEMAKHLPEEKAALYTGLAKRLTKALADHCAVKNSKESNGLLLHGTYCKSSPYNTCPNHGVDECTAWGDYFYMEALTRLSKDWNPYW